MSEVIQQAGARELRSHVYKTNRLSMAFHRHLGFRVVREDEKALAFVISVDALTIKRYFHTKKAIDADVKP